MTEEQIALARRAVACRGWRWMPGMRAFRDARYWQGVSDVRIPDALHDGGYPGFFPDLTDPATLGCLLALVREAWAEPTMHVRWNAGVGRWDVVARYSFPACAKTEAEALVAALEAAPCGQ